ncbi:VP1 protein [Wanken orbivirus]|nr:VP1 protein [Wanken orbivirus]
MVAVTQRIELVRSALRRIFSQVSFDGKAAIFEYYRFSDRIRQQRIKKGGKYQRTTEEIKSSISRGKETLYGLPVTEEATWKDLLISRVTREGQDALEVFLRSIQQIDHIDPEEEFLKHYCVNAEPLEGEAFIEGRAKAEMQIFGDTSILHWLFLLEQISVSINHLPLGLNVAYAFIERFGEPFFQNTRDLSNIKDVQVSYTIPLVFEMCVTESILELNMFFRSLENGATPTVEFAAKTFSLYDVIREFFIMVLPHPKKINNMLRAGYSWFVKSWGIMSEELNILESSAGDDRNSKDVYYRGFQRIRNPHREMMMQIPFYARSKKQNLDKLLEATTYSSDLTHQPMEIPIFTHLLTHVFETEFDPLQSNHMLLASLLLSIQTITGYGRAWVKNKSDDPEKQVRPTAHNFIERVSDYTRLNFVQAYQEAELSGFSIVRPADMYTSLLRMAKNTSSGFSAEIQIEKSFGPKARRTSELVTINTRIKAIVILQQGHELFTEESLTKKYNTTAAYQSKGSRDVPIKATRTIYAINLSVLAPQLILTLPLNEYFSKVGGATTPETKALAGKIIIGDLEATGSRVMDAADTFRNTGDPTIFTFALDFAEYDQHMTPYNFRKGMKQGMHEALSKFSAYTYDGSTVDELIESGFGEGRVTGTLWNGKRAIFRVSLALYEDLPEADRTPGEFPPAAGTRPISSVKLAEEISLPPDDFHTPYYLVSPTDGSDLALITTHLSGENSTLASNSLHNKGIGKIIIEEIIAALSYRFGVLSEAVRGRRYVILYGSQTTRHQDVEQMLVTVFETIEKLGHEASVAKTNFAPFSAEKTQTHAKQGVYIPQDRMMVVSSERRKDIEDIQGYMKSQVMTFNTKISRGFSEHLAHLILLFKSAIVGYRKLKRTVKRYDGEYTTRRLDSDTEDGFTLCMLRDPSILYIPVSWNGYGAHPVALNIVMTPEMLLDTLLLKQTTEVAELLLPFAGRFPPPWNETKADTHQIKAKTQLKMFHKLVRPTVKAALGDPQILEAVRTLPLHGFGPTSLSMTMMHAAMLKEARARALLAPGYELDYQKALNTWRPDAITFDPSASDMEIRASYIKMFDVTIFPVEGSSHMGKYCHPDLNLSPSFLIQKQLLGNRMGQRTRMSYVDRIDTILRGDMIMRGFITAQTIMGVMEEIGTHQSAEDLATIFRLMNLDAVVADQLAGYIASQRARFDVLRLSKAGIAGDEFSMSLDIATDNMMSRFVHLPREFTKTETDAASLYISQLYMLRAAVGIPPSRIQVSVSPKEIIRMKQRTSRLRSHLPTLRRIRKGIVSLERTTARLVEHQFS